MSPTHLSHFLVGPRESVNQTHLPISGSKLSLGRGALAEVQVLKPPLNDFLIPWSLVLSASYLYCEVHLTGIF